jgi:hypothetical protein
VGKSMEVVEVLQEKKIDASCVQGEGTRCVNVKNGRSQLQDLLAGRPKS